MTEISVPTGNAVEQLAFFLDLGSRITKMSESPVASNGLSYCYVEVTGPEGSHYILQAYGQEAVLLYETASKENER
jgi:hypothetical protein